MFIFLDVSDEFEDAAEHFAYVFAVHPEPDRMLRVLQGYIPPTLIQSIKSLIPVARRVSDPSLFRLVFVYLLMFVIIDLLFVLNC